MKRKDTKEKYRKYAETINEWARAKQLEAGMSHMDIWDALKWKLPDYKGRPAKKIADILSQMSVYGFVIPDIILSESWQTRQRSEKERARQGIATEYRGSLMEYAEGLPVSNCRPTADGKQIIYTLK